MNNKYTIVASHPDDEFIGCRQFILANAKNIESIIFVTNGERSLYEFVEPSFAYQRRKESEGWIKSVCRADIYYLNVPDNTNSVQLQEEYGANLFLLHNRIDKWPYLKNKIREIAKNNVLVFNTYDHHPSHQLTYHLCYNHPYPIIQYAIQDIFLPISLEPGIYKDPIVMKQAIYKYVYTTEEYEKKLKEFQLYYVSQHEDFQKSGYIFVNIEEYLTELDINLRTENV